MERQRRVIPKSLDQPIRILVFDKEDGIVALFFIFLLSAFMDNMLVVLMVALTAMIIVNRLKANKPKGYIIHMFYKYVNLSFSLPKYIGKRRRIRP